MGLSLAMLGCSKHCRLTAVALLHTPDLQKRWFIDVVLNGVQVMVVALTCDYHIRFMLRCGSIFCIYPFTICPATCAQPLRRLLHFSTNTAANRQWRWWGKVPLHRHRGNIQARTTARSCRAVRRCARSISQPSHTVCKYEAVLHSLAC